MNEAGDDRDVDEDVMSNGTTSPSSDNMSDGTTGADSDNMSDDETNPHE